MPVMSGNRLKTPIGKLLDNQRGGFVVVFDA
jgi:hypothetical protein